MTREITLTNGGVTLVDDCDFDWLSSMKWHLSTRGYVRHSFLINGQWRPRSMSRLILDAPDGVRVDHRNGNKQDNTRGNLRFATGSQNGMNKTKQQRAASSIYKGVRWHLHHRLWNAQIQVNGKSKYLGGFKDEIAAARAYDRAAIELFGEWACVNFPNEIGRPLDRSSVLAQS